MALFQNGLRTEITTSMFSILHQIWFRFLFLFLLNLAEVYHSIIYIILLFYTHEDI
ncbi:hypothetical protein RchiOBHm_Chr5g0036841 [Rosa chinensis]|uniref:Uncharacterized protein n=1 Tax=Rosa chinensis TaxID=74649 RepID=A0A2P6QBL8_ROSCH|nr:hypothetical protein RchiOBHm_Chr5g0036841 [Rosa chinensis]